MAMVVLLVVRGMRRYLLTVNWRPYDTVMHWWQRSQKYRRSHNLQRRRWQPQVCKPLTIEDSTHNCSKSCSNHNISSSRFKQQHSSSSRRYRYHRSDLTERKVVRWTRKKQGRNDNLHFAVSF